jgi:filamentous hemagglutinin
VSQLEATQLGPEIEWVNRQQEAGLFNYTPGQKITDMAKSDPLGVAKDAAKVVVGAATAKTGLGLCTTALGCTAGVPMAAFGASDMAEGADSLYNRYNGINAARTNPFRYVFNEVNPTWGDTMYDALNLGASVLALRAQVPLKIGVADGLNRPGTMFDVTASRMNNATLIPFVNTAAPYGTTQAISMFGIASKGATVAKDVDQAGAKK